LHDDLGSTLNSILIYTNLALVEENKEPSLKKIKRSTHAAITDLRDIIWVMDDKKKRLKTL
jgi:hypothetical protein